MSTDPIQTLLVAANYYDAMSEVGGARDALTRMEQLRDAAAAADPAMDELIAWIDTNNIGCVEVEQRGTAAWQALRNALAGCATTQENT